MEKEKDSLSTVFFRGGDKRDRTADLLNAMEEAGIIRQKKLNQTDKTEIFKNFSSDLSAWFFLIMLDYVRFKEAHYVQKIYCG